MRRVTIEEGPINTVKFVSHPLQGRVAGKMSAILFDHEIPEGDIESFRARLEAQWKPTVREFGLDVELG